MPWIAAGACKKQVRVPMYGVASFVLREIAPAVFGQSTRRPEMRKIMPTIFAAPLTVVHTRDHEPTAKGYDDEKV
jgi:hypothetical protein